MSLLYASRCIVICFLLLTMLIWWRDYWLQPMTLSGVHNT